MHGENHLVNNLTQTDMMSMISDSISHNRICGSKLQIVSSHNSLKASILKSKSLTMTIITRHAKVPAICDPKQTVTNWVQFRIEKTRYEILI